MPQEFKPGDRVRVKPESIGFVYARRSAIDRGRVGLAAEKRDWGIWTVRFPAIGRRIEFVCPVHERDLEHAED